VSFVSELVAEPLVNILPAQDGHDFHDVVNDPVVNVVDTAILLCAGT
jgi:hypothetical protein